MYPNDNKLFFDGIIKYLIKFRNYLTELDLFFFGCGYSDEVITNISGAIDAKYRQIALLLVFVHKPLNLGYLDPLIKWYVTQRKMNGK